MTCPECPHCKYDMRCQTCRTQYSHWWGKTATNKTICGRCAGIPERRFGEDEDAYQARVAESLTTAHRPDYTKSDEPDREPSLF